MKSSINKYRFICKIKWVIYYIFRYFVIFEHIVYSKLISKRSKIKRRLFVTSGNISLVNTLAIINEIGNFDKYKDTLIIETGKGGNDFALKNKEMASLYNFDKIICETRLSAGVIAVLHNQFSFDEVYTVNHPNFIGLIVPLYPNADVTIIDEGPALLMDYNISKYKNIKNFKTHKYLDKIDYLSTNNVIQKYTFTGVNIEEFRKISNNLILKYPIKFENNLDNKYVLYCGINWEVIGIKPEKFAKLQQEIINDLINTGYKILYKPHPRDYDFYGFDKDPNVQFIDCKYPIDLYKLDIVALVSVASSASISYAHYWDIPCFANIQDNFFKNDNGQYKGEVIKKIMTEYIPNYKLLLQLDAKNTPKEKLKLEIKQIYKSFIDSKPLLSENREIIDLYQEWS